MDSLRSANREMDKKQRKFDQQLLEERSQAAKIAAERDTIAQEVRERETKVNEKIWPFFCRNYLRNGSFLVSFAGKRNGTVEIGNGRK